MRFAFDIGPAALGSDYEFDGWVVGITVGRFRIELWFGEEKGR